MFYENGLFAQAPAIVIIHDWDRCGVVSIELAADDAVRVGEGGVRCVFEV